MLETKKNLYEKCSQAPEQYCRLEKFYVNPAKNPVFGNTAKPVKDEIALS
jgi:hypothetical protein